MWKHTWVKHKDTNEIDKTKRNSWKITILKLLRNIGIIRHKIIS